MIPAGIKRRSRNSRKHRINWTSCKLSSGFSK